VSVGDGADPLVARLPGRRGRRVRVGEVRYGLPELRQDPDTGEGLGVRVRIAVGSLTEPWSRAALFLRMAFDDTRIEAVDAGIDPPVGVVSVSGLRTNEVGWYLGALSGGGPLDFAAHVRLDVPAQLAELTGTLRVEGPVTRPRPVFLPPVAGHARTPALREFALERTGPAPAGPPPVDTLPGPAAVQAHELEPAAAVRLCFAADIERYSRFRNPEAVRAQQRLIDVLARARHRAGVAEERVETQESGDGLFVVLPTGLDESEVIPALVQGLYTSLAELNADLNEHARLRLRVALHRGHIERGANGWAGTAAVAVHRLLDSQPARLALSGRAEADFVLIVPDSLYQDVIAQGYGLLRPEAFRRVDVSLPAKNFADRAWIYIPGSG
jgi:hypothetical protein